MNENVLKDYEFEGKTPDDAIEKGLETLKTSKDKVKIEIVSAGTQGLFGLLGAKPAKIKITVPLSDEQQISEIVSTLLDKMDIENKISTRKEEGKVCLEIDSPSGGIIIGKRGETLNALQYITNVIVNRTREKKIKVIIDLEGYRDKREKTLVNLAKRIADKTKSTGKSVALEPMTANERRIIHAALSDEPGIETHSSGTGRFRKVIVSSASNN